ncbi:preprotein translocase subunit SecE [Succinivibrio sp.]|uniref:preprotein translocase subunit SecE n=1 Tax=Succinivibrio sp. TaxID=2053619 RepID=UPI00387072C8
MADNKGKVATADKKNTAKKPAQGAKADLFISPALSAVFWILSVVIVASAIIGNYYYTNFVVVDETTFGRLARVAIVILGLALGLGSALLTNKGRALLSFSRQAYTELRKVVWPTRQEAVQTTFIVFVAVCVVSLFLYFCDVIFLQIVRLFTL